MDKYKYIITCTTDPYHAGRQKRHEGHRILRRDTQGTPIEWVHDDNNRIRYTFQQACAILNSYYTEDKEKGSETERHNFFDKSYTSDVYTYRIVKLD